MDPNQEPIVRRVELGETGDEPELEETPRPASKQKLTAEDMEAKFAQMGAKAKSWRESGAGASAAAKLTRTITTGALALGIVAMGLSLNAASDQFEAQTRSNQLQINDLTGQLADLNRQTGPDGQLSPEATATATEDLRQGLHQARERAEELAQAQQEFAVIGYAGRSEPSAGAGVPSAAGRKAVEQRKTLAEFFSSDSFVLPDDVVSSAVGSGGDSVVGKIDPRMAWFVKYDAEGEIADPAGSLWQVASVTPSTSSDVVDVMWTNADPSGGRLYAWATAKYSIQSDTFSSVTVNKTSYGSAAQQMPITEAR